jgi:hypothetical protein
MTAIAHFQFLVIAEHSMRGIQVFFPLALAAVCATSAMGATPENLRNKSFTVSWTEQHNQSVDGGEFRDYSVPYRLTYYISSVGRGFSRWNIGSGRGAGSHDQVGKDGQPFALGGEHGMTFTNSGFVLTGTTGEAARRISIDSTGSGCSATVTVGKMPRAEVAKFTRTDGRHYEIRALSAGAASCQMQEGNTFAN